MRRDSRSSKADAYRPWYQTKLWRDISRQHRQAEPLCRMCAARGIVRAAQVTDHIERHDGDWAKFIAGPFQSLCKPCHDSTKQSIERRGYDTAIGADGYPIDERHPSNR